MVSRIVMAPPLFHVHRILVADILADTALDALIRYDAVDLFFFTQNSVLRTVRYAQRATVATFIDPKSD